MQVISLYLFKRRNVATTQQKLVRSDYSLHRNRPKQTFAPIASTLQAWLKQLTVRSTGHGPS